MLSQGDIKEIHQFEESVGNIVTLVGDFQRDAGQKSRVKDLEIKNKNSKTNNGQRISSSVKNFGDEEVNPTVNYNEEENEDRGNWSGRFDFLVVAVGYAVGVGNIATFPVLCHKHGGAAFLIPYVLALMLVGAPVVFLEMALGQFTSCSSGTCWEFAPIVKGLGFAMVFTNVFTTLYYTVYPARAFIYMAVTIGSLSSTLPWMECHHDFNTQYCLRVNEDRNCSQTGIDINKTNGACYNATTGNFYGIWNESLARKFGISWNLSSDEYFNIFVLGKTASSGIEHPGMLKWMMSVAYVVTWLLIFLVLIRGIKSLGKVLYVTVFFPFALMVALAVQALIIDTDGTGVREYLGRLELNKLSSPEPWTAAATHVLFSLGAGYGVLIFLASHNRFHHPLFRDAINLVVIDTVFSLLGGFAVYPLIAQLAKITGFRVESLTQSNTQLLFEVYPAAVAGVIQHVPHLWMLLYLLMVVCICMNTVFCNFEAALTALRDLFHPLRHHSFKVLLVSSMAFAALGLIFCVQGGDYYLILVEYYVGTWNVLFISLLETVCIVYIYGVRRLCYDVSIMLGHRICGCMAWRPCSWYWVFCWSVCTPFGLLGITVFAWVQYAPLRDGLYVYPMWANILGWILAASAVLWSIVTAVILLCITPGTIKQRLRSLFRPTKYWGPALVKHRLYFKNLYDWVVDPWGPKEKIDLSVIFHDDIRIDGKSLKLPLSTQETSFGGT